MKEHENGPEKFDEDADQNLQWENEILKLKLQAERGAIIGGDGNVPPEIENEFLKHIQQFDKALHASKTSALYELLGKPAFIPANELGIDQVKIELDRLKKIMAAKSIVLHQSREYDPMVIYKFITEELFQTEADDMQIPGFSQNYIYEEFHPDHEADIRSRAKDFFRDWFERGFDEYSNEIAREMMTAEGQQYSRTEMFEKLNSRRSFYKLFSDIEMSEQAVSFQWDEKEKKGLGHAEGFVRYKAELDGNEFVNVEGPYKFYCANEDGYWNIFYFVMPGFGW